MLSEQEHEIITTGLSLVTVLLTAVTEGNSVARGGIRGRNSCVQSNVAFVGERLATVFRVKGIPIFLYSSSYLMFTKVNAAQTGNYMPD